MGFRARLHWEPAGAGQLATGTAGLGAGQAWGLGGLVPGKLRVLGRPGCCQAWVLPGLVPGRPGAGQARCRVRR
ncbi:hypothetical protein [Lentzea waywayandensis]|uniref:hypothetical protein n=1 Tax=Lentzea waywayandensis TaxID=84724 RepID=UPI0011603B9D|nr:hypothetical protein [Lentzea waywayandensis]